MPANPDISTLSLSSGLSSASTLHYLETKDPRVSRLSAAVLKNGVTVSGTRFIAYHPR
jgi:hypothetical protein